MVTGAVLPPAQLGECGSQKDGCTAASRDGLGCPHSDPSLADVAVTSPFQTSSKMPRQLAVEAVTVTVYSVILTSYL